MTRLAGPQPGERFGKYDVEQFLGNGAMGAVYRARDTRLDRHVALKVVLDDDDEGLLQRFVNEGRALAKLASPRIAHVYEAGDVAGTPYIAMQLIDGVDLGTLLRQRGGALTVGQAVRLVGHAAEGLAYAHDRGVLHRDIKPPNLLVDGNDDLRLADFGIAWHEDWTRTWSARGTLAYLAPERLGGITAAWVDAPLQPWSRATDVYALGCVLWELVAGARSDAHLRRPGEPAPQLAPDHPASVLNPLLAAMLAEAADARPSATALVAALADLSAGLPTDVTPMGSFVSRLDPTVGHVDWQPAGAVLKVAATGIARYVRRRPDGTLTELDVPGSSTPWEGRWESVDGRLVLEVGGYRLVTQPASVVASEESPNGEDPVGFLVLPVDLPGERGGHVRAVVKLVNPGRILVAELLPGGGVREYDLRAGWEAESWTGTWEEKGDQLTIAVGDYRWSGPRTSGSGIIAGQEDGPDGKCEVTAVTVRVPPDQLRGPLPVSTRVLREA